MFAWAISARLGNARFVSRETALWDRGPIRRIVTHTEATVPLLLCRAMIQADYAVDYGSWTRCSGAKLQFQAAAKVIIEHRFGAVSQILSNSLESRQPSEA